jgi:hypothetical protein
VPRRRVGRARPAHHQIDRLDAGNSPRRGHWQRWAPYAAVAWSLAYAALGLWWASGGPGFPYTPQTSSDALGPMLGRFGSGAAWATVIAAGFPAAAAGLAMLRGVRGRVRRPLLLAGGALLASVLLLFMTGLTLLVLFGYFPYLVVHLFTRGDISQKYLSDLVRWPVLHQLLCLAGGFLWLAATIAYSRTSGDACPSCGRRDRSEWWQGRDQAGRWGRIAVYLSMMPPVFYAFTRYAWALGFALGMSEADLRRGQANGMWISGLFLATFGLLGAALTLGLVHRWGEVFPRWMIGLAGRRVPVALAVVPAAFVSVLLAVGGVVVWAQVYEMAARLAAGGAAGPEIVATLVFGLGAVLLFPVWGAALAVATLAYYYRRRPPCGVCGLGNATAVAAL